MVLVGMMLAVVAVSFPLQHHMTLSRFQHYAIGISIWALGYLIQLAISWRALGAWGRATLVYACFYMASIAFVIYTNPWLDHTVQLQTNSQGAATRDFLVGFGAETVLLAVMLLVWNAEEKKRRRLSDK